ncbi:unnamed protein product [Phytophthora fragariaefolia]|uniref:Unnamed protein product n=1 Tax=Phytophthora fragariaefolia TaxID=1490495 RepID=A0A9W6Y955_9STRA|nr:unnamed protein product [Phytophthora fragariaefolia]
MDKDLLKREQQLYADWLARQPPAVERRQYAVPKDVMKRSPRRVDNGEAELTCAQQHELLGRAAAASAESASDRTEAAVTSTKSARDGLHTSETTESTADDSVRYEPAESAGDGPASTVQAVATSCELTDCDIAESAVAAQTDAAEWNDGPNAGAAHHARLGVTILEAKSPGQPPRETDSKKERLIREAVDCLLSDEIEVSDVALADDPEDDLLLRFVATIAICEAESTTAVDKSATDPAEFKCPANEIDLDERATESTFRPDMNLPRDFVGHVLSFDGSAMSTEDNGYGSRSWILWRLPSWDIEIAASAHLLATTVDIAEYTGMNNGVKAALERDITALIIVGDPQLAIHQSMGAIACKEDTQMARHKKLADQLSSVRYLHVLGRYNAAADSLATNAFGSKMGRVVLSGDRKAELKELNRISEVLYARADSADSARPKAEIAAASMNHARRVRFKNETKLDPAKRNQKSEQHKVAPVMSCSEAERLEFASPGVSSRVRRVEGQAEASADKSRVPDSVNNGPVVMHAGRRGCISKTQDEELRWADQKTLLVREPGGVTRHAR